MNNFRVRIAFEKVIYFFIVLSYLVCCFFISFQSNKGYSTESSNSTSILSKGDLSRIQNSPYYLTWTAPSENIHGTMPLGNGEIGLNVWINEQGVLEFYIGRTDAWDDFGRLV